MEEQLKFFSEPNIIYCEITRYNRKIKGWVVPYGNSEWSGAWYSSKQKALIFWEYCHDKGKML